MEKLNTKLILAIFFTALIAAGAFYLTIKYRRIAKQNNIKPFVSVNDNKNKASQDILQMIGPPPGFVASKAPEPDPEILKLIGLPPGFKPSTSTAGEVSLEILKLIGPPDKIN